MNSKSIGNNYEREFIKKFSKWVVGNDDILIAWRNVHSGSISTNRMKLGKDGSNMSGDFQCISPEYQYIFDRLHIDSKCYKEINLFFINSKNKKSNSILQQWIKTCDEAYAVNKLPVMPVKIRDRSTPEFILFPIYGIDEIKSLSSIKYHLNNTKLQYDFILYMQDDLFNNLPFESFSKLL